jgi:NADH-quinone oxidoreductase subunit D
MSEPEIPAGGESGAGAAHPDHHSTRTVLNMGPQHPSTHGVLRLMLELDGETILRAEPDVGYLHTGIEKQCESKTYQQVVPLTDRVDYLANLSNNLCYVLAVERLLGLEVPPQAQWMRVMLTELTRISSHLVWLGTHAIDIGAMSVFLYCFREREDLLRIFEMFSGQRMMTSYFRVGGLALEPPRGWHKPVGAFLDRFPAALQEYEDLLTANPIWKIRTKARWVPLDDLLIWRDRPMIRAAGLAWDIVNRSRIPATRIRFRHPNAWEGDVYARYEFCWKDAPNRRSRGRRWRNASVRGRPTRRKVLRRARR